MAPGQERERESERASERERARKRGREGERERGREGERERGRSRITLLITLHHLQLLQRLLHPVILLGLTLLPVHQPLHFRGCKLGRYIYRSQQTLFTDCGPATIFTDGDLARINSLSVCLHCPRHLQSWNAKSTVSHGNRRPIITSAGRTIAVQPRYTVRCAVDAFTEWS